MSAHARLSPSAAERWMNCPGSVQLAESLGVRGKPTRFSAEGTFAHSVRAAILEGKEPPPSATIDGFDFKITPEMLDHLQPGIDRLSADMFLALEESAGMAAMLVEHRVDLGPWIAGAWGTADAVVVARDLLVVDDLKYGAGRPVAAEGNLQLMTYALGCLSLNPRVARVVLRIDQPRVAGGASSWEIGADALRAWGETVLRPAALAAAAPGAPLVPSEDACRWCPAKAVCPALAAHALEVVAFDDLDAPWAGRALTPTQRSRVLEHKVAIEKWLEALHSAALADALAGLPVPGFKVVEGRRGNRQWRPGVESTLVGLLGEDAYERKLISPAQADKKLGAKEKVMLVPLVEQPDGKPCLVPEDDKRPAIPAGAMFDVIESDPVNPWE